jgi:phytoene dehydrogenase-like protein
MAEPRQNDDPDPAARAPEVIIVGAGVAGLACAVTLHRAGRRVRVLEAGEAVGGRVRTDPHEGFALDRGFQVLLTAYPSCRRLLDFNELRLGRFEPGARIALRGRHCVLADPLRRPLLAVATLAAPVGSLADKLRVARLRRELLAEELEAVWRRPNIPTLDFLRGYGFNERMLRAFFQPFLAGIFLEADLRTSARMFAFVYRCFAAGDAALPAGGMGAIPAQLSRRLPSGAVQLRSRVVAVERHGVTLADGRSREADAVVVATDLDTARQWLPELPARSWNGGVCHYFDAPARTVKGGKWLWLNGTGSGRINHVAVPSAVAAGYAPAGRALVSVNTVGSDEGRDDPQRIQRELGDLFGAATAEWRHLKACPVPRSLPACTPADLDALDDPPTRLRGIHLCGDLLGPGSLETAMRSGIEAAGRIVAGK